VLARGKVAQTGTVQEVFNRPANLDVAGIVAVETILPGRIIETAGGLVTVSVGDALLTAAEQPLPSGAAEVHVCIRAGDVSLLKYAGAQGSPRNHLPGIIRALVREGAMMRVDLDCGFPLAALVTVQACGEMSLQPGAWVVALVKAPHVHLIPR
jgi:molybdate transport system ATP-binding protein